MAELKVINKDKIFQRQSKAPINPYATAEEIRSARVVNEIGYGIQTPQTAIDADYYDRKCPFTGDVNVSKKIFKGIVHKMKAEKTIVVINNYLFFDKKYKRYARRNTKINVHLSPCFNGLVQVGDVVVCGQTRPLSKTKNSVVLAVEKKSEEKHVKVFRGF